MQTKFLTIILLLISFTSYPCKNINFIRHTFLQDSILTQLQTKAVITSQTIDAYCFLNSNGTVYDLNLLNRKNDDYNQTLTNNDTLFVNLCSKANRNCPNKTALATYIYGKSKQCIALSGEENTYTSYIVYCKKIH